MFICIEQDYTADRRGLHHAGPACADDNGAAQAAAPYKLLERLHCDLSKFPDCEFFRVEVSQTPLSAAAKSNRVLSGTVQCQLQAAAQLTAQGALGRHNELVIDSRSIRLSHPKLLVQRQHTCCLQCNAGGCNFRETSGFVASRVKRQMAWCQKDLCCALSSREQRLRCPGCAGQCAVGTIEPSGAPLG